MPRTLQMKLNQVAQLIGALSTALALSACGGGGSDAVDAAATGEHAVAETTNGALGATSTASNGSPAPSIDGEVAVQQLASTSEERLVAAVEDSAGPLPTTRSAVPQFDERGSDLVDTPLVAPTERVLEVAASAPTALALNAASNTDIAADASAAVYYVDSRIGNDANTGTAAAAGAGGLGPWRTLARVAKAPLVPGDTVRLACGGVWDETLRLPSSGVPGKPIVVTAASASCPSMPMIDGAVSIPPAAWVRHSGTIYRTTLADTAGLDNLVQNGNFAVSDGGWHLWSPQGDANLQYLSNCVGRQCASTMTGADSSVLSSRPFAVIAGKSYAVEFTLKAPAGAQVRVLVRRSAAPWDALGYTQTVLANGNWQSVKSSFTASLSLADARLDFELPARTQTVQVASTGVFALGSNSQSGPQEPLQLFASTGLMTAAHHPNRGFDAKQPNSVYLRNAADSNQAALNGRTVSTYITTGPDLKLPAGASIPNGTPVRIRTNSWVLNESTTSGHSGGRISLATPTAFPLAAGWGYFLLGQLWMVDSPGEWFYDRKTQALYAWMPDSAAPATAMAVSQLSSGADLKGRNYITLDGLYIRRVGIGIDMRGSTGVVVRNSRIEDTASLGIDAHSGASSVIDSCTVQRTGGDAISGADDASGPSVDMRVLNSTISQSGVLVVNDKVLSLPGRSRAAIRGGLRATITGNTVTDSGFIGIWPMAGSLVSDNVVSGACTILDDCAGIYTSNAPNGSVIRHNIVHHSRGAVEGKAPAMAYTQAQGIYLDEDASGVTVEDNTVFDADNGIQIHVASNNTIRGNKLYGNRNSQLWLQETRNRVRASGDLFGNRILANQIVSTEPTARGFLQETQISNVMLFGNFDQNRYFDRIHARIGSDRWPGVQQDYTLSTWQAATAPDGTPRSQDRLAKAASEQRYASSLVIGSSIVPNGKLASHADDWSAWNQTAPFGSLSRQACASGYCAAYQAGASPGLLSSPTFSISKGQWYRLSVDVAAGSDAQPILMLVRRAGGGANGYEPLSKVNMALVANRAMQRYSFLFQATQTINANDPATLDRGARVDFQNIPPGQRISVTNLEIVPTSAADATTRTDLLINTQSVALQRSCPTAASQPAVCAQYVRLSDGSAISWPLLLAPRSSEIIYTLDGKLVDTDGDGIADSQDACPGTANAAAVNSNGCSAAQRP